MLFGQSLNRFAKRIGALAELSAYVFVQLDADGRYAGGCGDERLGRFDRLAKRAGGGEAKRENDPAERHAAECGGKAAWMQPAAGRGVS